MKLNGISDSGLRRIANKIGVFMAEPPVPQHEKYQGIIEYPGFHTTESFDIAASYAVGRVKTSFTEGDDGINYVTDYPVVVALDMSGFIPDVDYDAIEIVAPVLEVQLEELIGVLDDDPTDEEIVTAAEDMIQSFDNEYEANEDPAEVMTEFAMWNMKNPLAKIYENPDFPNALREYMQNPDLKEGPLTKILMDATDQYRYTQDVSEKRVVGVWFVVPVAEEMIEDTSEEDFEEVEARWPGFDVFSQDDVYGGTSYNSEQVYENLESEYDDDVQLSLFTKEQLAVEPKIQYHGTTYKRLLEAAPFLDGVLPEPPNPPYQG